jgi:hypothetical protein
MPMPRITLAAGQNLKTAMRVDKGSILKVRIVEIPVRLLMFLCWLGAAPWNELGLRCRAL